jgi:uncharacterized Ntn-hydrolase superfamily protein
MTFSITARDPNTGDIGIAVESKYLAVGSIVPHGRWDSGILATQFFANPNFSELALGLLAEGARPSAVVEALLEGDPHRVRRQLVVMRTDGQCATFTGEACLDVAGAIEGPDVVCCGNTLVGDDVLRRMSAAYEHNSDVPFWYRLLAALAEGQAAGGDRNGQQSAALLVLRPGAGYGGYTDRMIDLRVDDSPQPIHELTRLVDVWTRTVIE